MAVINTNINLLLRRMKGVVLTHDELDDNQEELRIAIENHSHEEIENIGGGTIGQHLVKKSNDDYDYKWVDEGDWQPKHSNLTALSALDLGNAHGKAIIVKDTEDGFEFGMTAGGGGGHDILGFPMRPGLLFTGDVIVSDNPVGDYTEVNITSGSGSAWTWKGDWTDGLVYREDDVVYFNGTSFLAIQEHYSTPNNQPFSLQSNGQPTDWHLYWNIVALKGEDGLYYRDSWDALNDTYVERDVVTYQGSAYFAKTDVPVGTLPTDTDYWSLFVARGAKGEDGDKGDPGDPGPDGSLFSVIGEWNNSTTYLADTQAVTYNGELWLALNPNLDSEPDEYNSDWLKIVERGTDGINGTNGTNGVDGVDGVDGKDGFRFRGEWSSATSYSSIERDVITHNGELWIAILPSTNSIPTDSNPNWQKLVAKGLDGLNYVGLWNISVQYIEDTKDVVSHQGQLWIATQNNISSEPSLLSSDWELIVTKGADGIGNLLYKGEYNLSTVYSQNDLISYNGNVYYSLLNNNTNPLDDPVSWVLFLSKGDKGDQGVPGFANLVMRGLWNSSDTYTEDIDVVTYNDELWLSLTNNSNQPPSRLDTTNWLLLVARGFDGDDGFGDLILKGAWDLAVTYEAEKDVVTHNDELWLAIVGSTNSEPDEYNSDWLRLVKKGKDGKDGTDGVDGFNVRGNWNSSDTYIEATRDIVIHDNQIWMAVTNNIASEPDEFNTDWQLIVARGKDGYKGFNFLGEWADDVDYDPTRNDVVAHNEEVWLALSQNIDSEPEDGNLDWFKLVSKGKDGYEGFSIRGLWGSLEFYEKDKYDVVTYDDELWLAIKDSDNSVPTIYNSDWQRLVKKGEDGKDGKDGKDGVADLFCRGAWKSVGTYEKNKDIVSYDGQLWLAQENNSNSIPDENNDDWLLIVRKGQDGADGVDGFNFLNEWSDTYDYKSATKDAVTFNGHVWVALRDNKNSEPGDDPEDWLLIIKGGSDGDDGVDGFNFLGAWDPDAEYEYLRKDAVTYNGSIWLAIDDNTNSVPSDISPYWRKVLAKGADGVSNLRYKGIYDYTLTYDEGDLVTYNGNTYFSTKDDNTGDILDPSSWILFLSKGDIGTMGPQGPKGDQGDKGLTFKGTWSPSITYQKGDVVYFQGDTYHAVSTNSGESPDEPGSVFWQLLIPKGDAGATLIYRGDWEVGTKYNAEEIVTHNGITYVAKLTNTGFEPPNATFWDVFVDKGRDGINCVWMGQWNDYTEYSVTNLVTHEDSLWYANKTNIDSEPSLSSPDWDLFIYRGLKPEDLQELLNKKLDADALNANLTFYFTDVAHDTIVGFNKLVTEMDDPDYPTTPLDLDTGIINAKDVEIASFISTEGLIKSHLHSVNVTVIGRVKVTSGELTLYFKVYQRKDDGTEYLIGTSEETNKLTGTTNYQELHRVAFVDCNDFDETDRIVIKFYGSKGGANGSANIQIGGTSPCRALFPVPVDVLTPKGVVTNLGSGDDENIAVFDEKGSRIKDSGVNISEVLIQENAPKLTASMVAPFNPDPGELWLDLEDDSNAVNGSIIKNLGGISSVVEIKDLEKNNILQAVIEDNVQFVFPIVPNSILYKFTLYLKNEDDDYTVDFPIGTKWEDGTEPTRSDKKDEVDIWEFITFNGGTNWIGKLKFKNIQ